MDGNITASEIAGRERDANTQMALLMPKWAIPEAMRFVYSVLHERLDTRYARMARNN